MRNIYIFHLLCFVLSFPLYAQDACVDEGVEVSIADITWNTTSTDLDDMMDTTFDFDLSILKSNKPVVLLFPTEIGYGVAADTPSFMVNPLFDIDMMITGFHIWRLDVATMGGVATSAGLMVRESVFGSLCIDLPDEVVRECRSRILTPINIFPIQIGWRKAQSPQNQFNIYPIPSQNNVFIDVQTVFKLIRRNWKVVCIG